jgi:hypothetical protein
MLGISLVMPLLSYTYREKRRKTQSLCRRPSSPYQKEMGYVEHKERALLPSSRIIPFHPKNAFAVNTSSHNPIYVFMGSFGKLQTDHTPLLQAEKTSGTAEFPLDSRRPSALANNIWYAGRTAIAPLVVCWLRWFQVVSCSTTKNALRRTPADAKSRLSRTRELLPWSTQSPNYPSLFAFAPSLLLFCRCKGGQCTGGFADERRQALRDDGATC